MAGTVTVYTVALALTQQYGLSCVPIADGMKTTPEGFRWKQYQSEIIKKEDAQKVFSKYSRMAIITGKVSGYLEVIDFDLPGRYEEWRQLLEDNGQDEIVSRLVIETTPRGGAHVYYRCPGHIEGNQKLALRFATQEELELKPGERAKATIETRGEGGLIVCFPTEGYVQVQGKLSEIPVITQDERDLLIESARSFHEAIEQRSDQSRREETGDHEDRPGHDFNSRASWFDLLPEFGWHHVSKRGQRDYWKRPGKDDPGISATTGNGDTDLLYVFSTSCYPLEGEKTYSKFAFYAEMKHRGDYSAAAKDLLARGFGRPKAKQPAPQQLADVHKERRFKPISYTELLNMPPKAMMIEGLLGERDNFMIFGLPKSGKTFVVMDLLLTCVYGGTFAEVFDVVRPLNVAYMTNEGTGSLHQRILASAYHNQVPYEDIQNRLHIFFDVPQLYDEDGPDSIANFADEWIEHNTEPLDLLVIDTMNKATLGADENSNSDAALIATHLHNVRKRLGCATCLVHHAGKDGERVRGASAFDGDLDFQLKIVKQEMGIRTMSLTMAKDLSGFEDLNFKLFPVNETCAITWLGSAECTAQPDALNTVIRLLEAARDKEWWTMAQICELLPAYKKDTIRKAVMREVNKPHGSAKLRVGIKEEGPGAHSYGLV